MHYNRNLVIVKDLFDLPSATTITLIEGDLIGNGLPLTGAPRFILIGRIGAAGTAFEVRASKQFTVTTGGPLYLGVYLTGPGAEAVTSFSRYGRGEPKTLLGFGARYELGIDLTEEDPALSGAGAMHEGELSALLGVAGIPSVSESTMVARDAALAGYEGGRIHIQHLSCLESVRAVAQAKELGTRITAEASPHHLCLTDAAVRSLDTRRRLSTGRGGNLGRLPQRHPGKTRSRRTRLRGPDRRQEWTC